MQTATVMNAQSFGGTGGETIADVAITYLGALPHSRKQETEADTVGLTLMLIAGYNGEEAINFWQRMASRGHTGKSDFAFAHPSDEKRVENLTKELSTAKETAVRVLSYDPQ
jgi:predicted Zn-dependent protease